MGGKVLHIVGQAHLDPVWLWPWSDGAAETLTTMQSAVDRMQENPGFCFSRSSAMSYRWAQEQDPRLFAAIRRRIRQGRWEVVNGWIVQPDCNLPGTESFVRHALYGKGYCARELGTDVVVGYNVDSFGHALGLPQLLSQAGYRYYVFMRPTADQFETTPLFWWEGPDGSRVLAWRLTTGYCQSPAGTPDGLERGLRRASQANFAPGFDHGLFFLGVGNHGGGPTKQQLTRIRALQKDKSLPELRFSTFQDFFAAAEASPALRHIPTVRGNLEHSMRGCYSSHSRIKALNRRAEKLLTLAEGADVMRQLSTGRSPRADATLEEAWWLTLFNQFHDILAGTCTEGPYRECRDQMGSACHQGKAVLQKSIHAMARNVDTRNAPGGLLFACNPLPWPRRVVIQQDTFTTPDDTTPITHLKTAAGRKLPLQWAAADAGFGPHLMEWKKLTAVLDLPACGYQVLHLAAGRGPAAGKTAPRAIELAEGQVGIRSLRTRSGVELLKQPVSLVVVEDQEDTWGMACDTWDKTLGRPTLKSTTILEDGPLLRTVRQRAQWRRSEIWLDITTVKGLDDVEIKIRVNWQEKRASLRLEIPTRITREKLFTQTVGGVSTPPADGREQHGQDWMALQGTVNKRHVSLGLLNDSTYSFDCHRGVLRSVIARAAPYAEHPPLHLPRTTDNPWLDQGWQEKRFWLLAGNGDFRKLRLHQRAQERQTPDGHMLDSGHAGTAPWTDSLLEVKGSDIQVLAIKAAEKGPGIILRLQEITGRTSEARILLPAWSCKHTLTLKPYEIRSLLLVRRQGKTVITEVDLLEQRK